mgnify:CR=1 FL=1
MVNLQFNIRYKLEIIKKLCYNLTSVNPIKYAIANLINGGKLNEKF